MDNTSSEHKENMARHIRTSFIFALAEFERLFGELWGYNIEDKNNLSKEQYQLYQKYKLARKAILDNGNNQIRLAEAEIEKLSISKYKFKWEGIKE